jgi:magnesium chelatase subunit I
MNFPFTAIVGQEELKTALIINVIDPGVGGLLVMGEKGTAKSTAVRALAELLPELETVRDCRFNCEPYGILCSTCRERTAQGALPASPKRMRVVELPLGITEKRFEAGLLADANRNFLYVDEVNLLEDHIIDLLLDSAAMGVNTVEREGISFSHPARFILVGTMNPEEGDLRPQLLDRFGLCVQVRGLHVKEERIEILKRKAAFDDDPSSFAENWKGEQEELAARIVTARERLSQVVLDDSALESIVAITTALRLDGHRPDIVIMKAARALAAYRGLSKVGSAEIRDAAGVALSHRQKRLPFEEPGTERIKLQNILEELAA